RSHRILAHVAWRRRAAGGAWGGAHLRRVGRVRRVGWVRRVICAAACSRTIHHVAVRIDVVRGTHVWLLTRISTSLLLLLLLRRRLSQMLVGGSLATRLHWGTPACLLHW